MAAGLATLKRLDEHAYLTLEMLGRVLEDDLGRAVRRSGVKARLQRIGSAFTLFFSPEEVVDMASATQGRTPSSTPSSSTACSSAASCCRPPSSRPAFLSLAHTMEDMQSFATAAREVLDELPKT